MSDRNEFYEEQTSAFDPDFNIEKAKNSRKTALRLARCLFRQKWNLLLVIFSILAGSLFEILSPKVLGTAIDEIYNGVKNAAVQGTPFRVNYETMGIVLFTLLGLYFLQSVFSFIQQRTMTTVSQTLTLSLRKEISQTAIRKGKYSAESPMTSKKWRIPWRKA